MEEQVSRTTAPYGHACTNCARAKCKCILLRDGNGCERCYRLGKECSPANTVRKRGVKKGTVRRTQLEDKLDELVSLLREQQSANASTNAQEKTQVGLRELADIINTPRWLQGDSGRLSSDAQEFWDDANLTPPTTASRSAPQLSPLPTHATVQQEEPPLVDPDTILDFFRTHHLKSFPVIYVPVTTNAAEFALERPLLWLTIRAICVRQPSLQLELGSQIKRALAEAAVVEGERNIDILLAILVHMAWSYCFNRGKPILGMLSSLAKTIVLDLRLDNMGTVKWPAYHLACVNPKAFAFFQPFPPSRENTDEERRALLACFILSTLVSSSLAVIYEPMKWSLQMDEAVTALSTNQECRGDDMLVAIARISRVLDEATQIAKHVAASTSQAGTVLMHVQNLKTSLDQLKTLVSPDLLQNSTLLGYFHIAEVSIYEIAFVATSPTSSTHNQIYDFKRIEYLHACLQAAKACCENYLQKDGPLHVGSSFPTMLHCSHTLHILFRLSMHEDPHWDRIAAKKEADVLNYLSRCAEAFEAMHASLGVEEESMILKAAQIQRLNAPAWKAALDTVGAEASAEGELQEGLDATLMELQNPEELWSNDILGVWDGGGLDAGELRSWTGGI